MTLGTPRRTVPAAARRGFTLIEILVATAVFAVLIGALYAVFYGAMRLRETTYERVETGLPRGYILSVIRRDLTGAVAPVGILAGPMLGESDTPHARRRDRLELCAASGIVTDDEPWGDVQRIEYYLEEPDEDQAAEGLDLVRTTTRNLLAPVEEEPEIERLLHGVDSLEITYFDGGSWIDSWDSTTRGNETPRAVRVRIGFAPADESENNSAPPLELICEIAAKPRATNSAARSPSNGGEGT